MTDLISLFLPSPPISSFAIGPVTIHIYALCLLAGIFFAAWLSARRYLVRGGRREQFDNIIFVAVIAGIIGGRLYHVISDYELYFLPGRNPWDALAIWNGGLGIWGAVGVGALAVWLMCRHYGIDFPSTADVIAPGLLFAQGIGRLGNWFNQELFGRPTSLPWGLQIDPAHRPAGYEQYATFHPTFLYELIWDVAGGFVLIWAERRFRLGRGKVFASYIVWYCFGRFFVEYLRIDPANRFGGFRLNNYTSAAVFLLGLGLLIWLLRRSPGSLLLPFGHPPASGLRPARPRVDEMVAGDGSLQPTMTGSAAAARVDPSTTQDARDTSASSRD